MLLPLIILATSGYYIYLGTVDSFDAVLDDVFLQVLPAGELREFLFQASGMACLSAVSFRGGITG